MMFWAGLYFLIGIITKISIDYAYHKNFEKSYKTDWDLKDYNDGLSSSWLAILIWPVFWIFLICFNINVWYQAAFKAIFNYFKK